MIALAWERGGEAQLVEFDQEAVVLRSTVPWPPGARVEARGEGLVLKIKVHGSKRQDDGSFVVRGRAFDLTRESREAIEARMRG